MGAKSSCPPAAFFCLLLMGLIGAAPTTALAQPAGLSKGEKQAWSIVDDVVHIKTSQANGAEAEAGFGFVVGERNGYLFVVTANHIFRKIVPGPDPQAEIIPAPRIAVTFHNDQAHHYNAELLELHLTAQHGDLAVLELPRPPTFSLTWPTLASTEAMVEGTKAWRIGKQGRWVPAATPGTFVERNAMWLAFDSLDTPPGSSGGPVVTENGIIGMIVQDGGLSGFPSNVLPIGTIGGVLRGWQVPWNLNGSSSPDAQTPAAPPAPTDHGNPPADPAMVELVMNMSMDKQRAIQHWLNQLGFFAGEEDGEFGTQTRQALRGYQSKIGVPATGFVDPALAQHLAADAQKAPANTSPSATVSAPRDLVYLYYGTEAGITPLETLRPALAQQITFYGQTLTREQVLQQHAAVYQRWPVRRFDVRPNSLVVSCAPTGISCRADGIVDYNLQSPERNARSTGSERFVLQLGRSNDGVLTIDGINSVGLERSSGPITPQPAPAVSPSGTIPAVDNTRWTTRTQGECNRHYYIWRAFGDRFQFVDQSNQVDIERVIERSPALVVTETMSSEHVDAPTPIGTRWKYNFQPDGSVHVQNLQNGQAFTLTRCGSP